MVIIAEVSSSISRIRETQSSIVKGLNSEPSSMASIRAWLNLAIIELRSGKSVFALASYFIIARMISSGLALSGSAVARIRQKKAIGDAVNFRLRLLQEELYGVRHQL